MLRITACKAQIDKANCATLVLSNGVSIAPNSGGGILNVVASRVDLLNGSIGSALVPLTELDIDGATFQLNAR
jgi:hypothetical protein